MEYVFSSPNLSVVKNRGQWTSCPSFPRIGVPSCADTISLFCQTPLFIEIWHASDLIGTSKRWLFTPFNCYCYCYIKEEMRTARFIATTRRNYMGRRIPSLTAQWNKEAIKLETKAMRWSSTTVAKALCTKTDLLMSNPTALLPFSCEITFEEDDDGT